MISYVIPTRDRPERLKATLRELANLGEHPGGAEVIIVDNASRERLVLPATLSNGIRVREIHLATNEGAAARNHAVAASDPASAWIVMLDDDSYPANTGFLQRLETQPADVFAVSADIMLGGKGAHRESGGLPEVFIGCGVAIRRDVFLRLGGYDPSFGYYVEEYDLAARMLMQGGRVAFDPAFQVVHAKVVGNRSMDLILWRLIRNNGWVAQRYAPEGGRWAEIREARARYRRIAVKENALVGFGNGLRELRRTIRSQVRTPMSQVLWDRFTGVAHARAALRSAWEQAHFASAVMVDPGKNSRQIAQVLTEMGVRLVGEGEDAEVIVIGTLSPGPMLDAYRRRVRHRYPGSPRVLVAWDMHEPMTKASPRRVAA